MTRFDDVLNILVQSDTRICARDFIKKIKVQQSVSTRSAKKILQTLIDNQELYYHYLYGTTYVEKSFLRPVKVSDHFTLTPPEFFNSSHSDDIQIVLHQGISFGSGQHPTTRLCLQAIDFCFFENPDLKLAQALSGADIGTGSGVLALAMCHAGLVKCHAHEIDPISINEAKKNIAHNLLENKILLQDTPFKEDKNNFSIICANLRWPTLKSLSNNFYNSLKPDGIAILSGVRLWEKEDLINQYTQKNFKLLWQKDEKNWSAFVLIKKLC